MGLNSNNITGKGRGWQGIPLDFLRTVEYYGINRFPMSKSAKFEGYGKLLGSLEQDIMELLWNKGEASGREVHANIASSRQVALTTVLTVLERLAKKGLVRKTKGESVFLFRPGYTRDEFARAVSQDVFKGIMDISSSGICASFVDALADADPDELERLSALIDSKKRELQEKEGK